MAYGYPLGYTPEDIARIQAESIQLQQSNDRWRSSYSSTFDDGWSGWSGSAVTTGSMEPLAMDNRGRLMWMNLEGEHVLCQPPLTVKGMHPLLPSTWKLFKKEKKPSVVLKKIGHFLNRVVAYSPFILLGLGFSAYVILLGFAISNGQIT